jgi:hypothetical protein
MHLPFELEHVMVWLLQDECGWTIIDCDLADNATRAARSRIFLPARMACLFCASWLRIVAAPTIWVRRNGFAINGMHHCGGARRSMAAR